MVYTVTLNPSLDYVIEVKDFQLGEVNRTEQEDIFPGGKGINVSILLKHLGISSCALGFLAGFTGIQIEALLQKEGIQTDFIKTALGDSRINVKLKAQEETEINGRGPVISSGELEKLYRQVELLTKEDWLVLAGSVPASLPKSVYQNLMESMQKTAGKVIVDATKDLLVSTLSYHPFLIKPNHQELGEIFGVRITSREEAIPYAKRLQEMGARNVLVSMAKEGALLLTEEGQIYEAAPPEGVVVNSVGAGDSMVAGFVAGYMQHKDYEEAFYAGLCSGSASAFSKGLATKAEIKSLLEQMNRKGIFL